MLKSTNSSLVKFTCVAALLMALFYIFQKGASLIIPFLLALLFSFAIIGLSTFYNKKIGIPYYFSFILSLLTYTLIMWFISMMILKNIDVKNLEILLVVSQRKFIELYHSIFASEIIVNLGIIEPENITKIVEKFNLLSIFNTTVGAFGKMFSQVGLILFFLVFILLESRFLSKKLYLFLDKNPKNILILETLEKIGSDIKTYFVIKTIVSVITGILCYFVMLCFGLKFAILWGFLAFALNYIPNIGSIVAVILPTILSIVQPDFTIYNTITMGILLTVVEILMGNIIEPQFMGNRLNLSPLVIIISLAFWYNIWGVVGMLLSVPIMAIINIILAKIPSTRGIAILLSEKGELQVDSPDVIIKRKKLLIKFKEKIKKLKS